MNTATTIRKEGHLEPKWARVVSIALTLLVLLSAHVASAQSVTLDLTGILSAPSDVEFITGEPSSTPVPPLPFGQGDLFVATVIYDPTTPISASSPTFNLFSGAVDLMEIEIIVSGGASFVYSASGGDIVWSGFDPIGPIEFDDPLVTGPAFGGFSPSGIGPDFDDPTNFFPTTVLPIIEPTSFPEESFFLSFSNAAGESFNFDSPFLVPEPGFGIGLALGALALRAGRRPRIR